jgi:O-antigen ligase
LKAATKEESMEANHNRIPSKTPLEQASTPTLLSKLFHDATQLLKKEMELARAEINRDISTAIGKVVALAVAGIFALLGLGLLCVAAVMALAQNMPAWQASLLVGGAMLMIAGVLVAVGKSKRVGGLERTQRTLKEDVQWAKERMA